MKPHLTARVLALLSSAALAAGCPAATPGQPGTGTTSPSTAPIAAGQPATYMAVFVLGVRTADSGIQVYNRLHGTTPAARLALLQADDEEEAADEEAVDEEEVVDDDETEEVADDETEASGDDLDEEAFLDEEWDEDEFEEFDISDDEEAYIDLDDDEVEEILEEAIFAELDEGEWAAGDRRLTQRLNVTADAISGDTGRVEVSEVVDAQGNVREGELAYTPDTRAAGLGLGAQKIRYDVPATAEKTGNEVDVTVDGGAGNVTFTNAQEMRWGTSTARFKEKVLPSGAVTLNGTVTTDTGLQLALTGQARPNGERDLTVIGQGYAIVFKNVKDIATARGFVLDKSPDDPTARVIARIQASPNAATTFTDLPTPVPYAEAKATLYRTQSVASGGGALGAEPRIANFRVSLGRADAAGAQAVSSHLTVGLSSAPHPVSVEGLNLSYMSDEADTYRVRDLTTRGSLAFTFAQGSAAMTVGEGAERVAVVENVDGSFLVGGRRAANAGAAGALLAATPVGRTASVHAVAGMRATLAGLPEEATRSACPPGNYYRVLAQCEAGKGNDAGYRILRDAVLTGWIEARQGR